MQFEGDFFDNDVIFIGEKNLYDGYYNDKIIHIKPSLKNFKKIIKYCITADLVVLYSLNLTKSFIANRLPSNVKIAWRFFGHELYSKMPDFEHSELTEKYLNLQEPIPIS